MTETRSLAEAEAHLSELVARAGNEHERFTVTVHGRLAAVLVSVRKGRLTPTAAGTRCRHKPPALWQHIVGRLPVGTKEFDRQAGWLALAVVGSGVPAQEWHSEISDLLFALGWGSGGDRYSPPPARSPTLDVIDQLAGAARTGWRHVEGADLAVAATARAVIRQG